MTSFPDRPCSTPKYYSYFFPNFPAGINFRTFCTILFQNIILNKTGKLVQKYTIRQISKYKKRIIVNYEDFPDMFDRKDSNDLRPTKFNDKDDPMIKKLSTLQ